MQAGTIRWTMWLVCSTLISVRILNLLLSFLLSSCPHVCPVSGWAKLQIHWLQACKLPVQATGAPFTRWRKLYEGLYDQVSQLVCCECASTVIQLGKWVNNWGYSSTVWLVYESILPLPLLDLLRYIVLIHSGPRPFHSFYHRPMAIKGKLLLFYYDQLWVVQYGETDS